MLQEPGGDVEQSRGVRRKWRSVTEGGQEEVQNSLEELGVHGEELQRPGGGVEQSRRARRTLRRVTGARRKCRTV